jgi:hypothetical protein
LKVQIDVYGGYMCTSEHHLPSPELEFEGENLQKQIAKRCRKEAEFAREDCKSLE